MSTKTKRSLYHMVAELSDIMEKHIDHETGEVTEKFGDIMDQLDFDIQEKIQSTAGYLKDIESRIIARKDHVKLLQASIKSEQGHFDRLKKYLRDMMDAACIKKSDGVYKVSILKGRASVDIIDEEAIPSEFKTPQPDAISKKDISDMLKNSGPDSVPGATWKIGENSITIR